MSRTTAQQMEAVVMVASGPPAESLAIRSEPAPEPGPGEVLVEVHAAAVNPLDAVNALGLLGTPLPMIPGVDYAGIVVSEGAHAGQEVWGSAPELGMNRPGTHARFVALPETWLSRKPARLTMTEAAGRRPTVSRGLADTNRRRGARARRDDPDHRRSRVGRPGRHGDRSLARRGADHCRPAQAGRR
jgi:NADPH:quinone reductase-like Zn-dependent oxidoreductase